MNSNSTKGRYPRQFPSYHPPLPEECLLITVLGDYSAEAEARFIAKANGDPRAWLRHYGAEDCIPWLQQNSSERLSFPQYAGWLIIYSRESMSPPGGDVDIYLYQPADMLEYEQGLDFLAWRDHWKRDDKILFP